MTAPWIAVGVLAVVLVALVTGGFLALAMGRLHLDLGWGRSLHRLGPIQMRIDARRELVYEILSAPYLGRARNESVDVLASGGGLAAAWHRPHGPLYHARSPQALQRRP